MTPEFAMDARGNVSVQQSAESDPGRCQVCGEACFGSERFEVVAGPCAGETRCATCAGDE